MPANGGLFAATEQIKRSQKQYIKIVIQQVAIVKNRQKFGDFYDPVWQPLRFPYVLFLTIINHMT